MSHLYNNIDSNEKKQQWKSKINSNVEFLSHIIVCPR